MEGVIPAQSNLQISYICESTSQSVKYHLYQGRRDEDCKMIIRVVSHFHFCRISHIYKERRKRTDRKPSYFYWALSCVMHCAQSWNWKINEFTIRQNHKGRVFQAEKKSTKAISLGSCMDGIWAWRALLVHRLCFQDANKNQNYLRHLRPC